MSGSEQGPTDSGLARDDDQDFTDADRGLLGRLAPGTVTDAEGSVVWDADAYGFLADDCPPTAHPSLWRQSRLVARQGLYEVVPGIYQVRGLDLSNISFVEGERGVIVIDPLISAEAAAAALALYREHRGARPVTAVIAPASQRGVVLGALAFVYALAGALSPWTVGRVVDTADSVAAGYRDAFLLTAALLAVTGLLALCLLRPERDARRLARSRGH